MVTSNQSQTKELLQRVNIRTMRKDLKQLREADSMGEREKIRKINPVKTVLQQPVIVDEMPLPPSAASVKIPVTVPQKEELQEVFPENAQKKAANDQLAKVLEHNKAEELELEAKLKGFATEVEKQQLFLLQSQRRDLESQIALAGEEKEPSLALEKNQILLSQKELQKKLSDIIAKGDEVEAQRKGIEEKEAATNVPAEKEVIEKEKWAKEEEKQELEKKRWVLEKELKTLEDKVAGISENYQASGQKETIIKTEIAKINDSLRAMYGVIAQREKAKKESPVPAQATKESFVKTLPDIPPKIIPQAVKPVVDDKAYLKDVSEAAKEKLATQTQAEQAHRRKFIEDVENWAALQEKSEKGKKEI